MSLLFPDRFGESSQRRRDLLLLAQFVGLLATGWLVWITSVNPRLTHQPFAAVAREALQHVMMAGMASAGITLGLYLLILQTSHVDALRLALRTSATAVWFAPATILLSAMSPAALAAALVLVVSTTRLLYSHWRAIHPAEVAVADRLMFEPPPNPFRLRDLAPGLAASLGLQAGAVAAALGYPLLAASLFSLSVSMLTLATLLAGVFSAERPPSLPRSLFGALLTLILAAGLTVGGLGFHFQDGDGNADAEAPAVKRGPLQSAREMMRKLMDKEKSGPGGEITNVYLPPAENVEIADETFRGVILWPETKLQAKLMVPAPTSPLSWLSPMAAKPLTIPFSGQYWMFKAPYLRPPKDSFFRRTTPLALSFVTTDHRTLAMEAWQRLDHPIYLSCCAAIQVSILNLDRYPGTVALELVLLKAGSPAHLEQSLGQADVRSRQVRNPNGLPAAEVLTFQVPAATSLRAFDEIKMIFHRASLRQDRSARISIESFILVPRGG